MNGKERIQRTLQHQPVDRVPIGFAGIDADVVEKILGHETYLRAKVKSQIALWEGRRAEVVQSWIEDTLELHRKLDILDVVRINGPYSSLLPPRDYVPERPRKLDDTTYQSKSGRVWKVSTLTDEVMEVTRQAAPGIHQFELPVRYTPPPASTFEVVDAVIAALKDTHYILGPCGHEAGMVMLAGSYTPESLMLYLDEPDLVQKAIAFYTQLGELEDPDTIRPGSDGIFWTMDFAHNAGTFISPRLFRKYCLPSIQKRVSQVKKRGLTVFKHACGNNLALLDMFVEAGYDAYQALQPSAGMDLARVKERVGKKLVLWGGVTVESLVEGTPEKVRQEVRDSLQTGKADGGFIFGTSHTVATGTKYENFMAMMDEFDRCSS